MRALQVLHISTFSPTQCGIATFTEDLIENLPDVQSHKLRMTYDGDSTCDGLFGVLALRDLRAYGQSVAAINKSRVDVISVQHEFGIFGGLDGEFIRELMDGIKRPIVVTLHTTSPDLSPHKQEILRHIVRASEMVVVLSEESAKFIRDRGGAAVEHVRVIRHGVPDVPFSYPEASAWRCQHVESLVIVSAGHVRPSKGYAVALAGLAKLRDQGIRFRYLILGKSQPQWDKSGAWGQELDDLIHRFHLENHVEWHRRYLDPAELCCWIQAADVGLVPYTESDQISSGILPIILACGRPVLATAFDCAKSISRSMGGVILTEINDPDQLCTRLREIAGHPDQLRAMMPTCYAQTRPWLWKYAAAHYDHAFRSILEPSLST
jgi:glycosyltransferase involved in cell wall biosynthesis